MPKPRFDKGNIALLACGLLMFDALMASVNVLQVEARTSGAHQLTSYREGADSGETEAAGAAAPKEKLSAVNHEKAVSPPSEKRAGEAFAAGGAAQKADTETRKAFNSLVDTFYDGVFRLNPNYATEAGVHDYDSLVPNVSAEGVRRQIRFLKDYLKRFNALDRAKLTDDQRIDLSLLVSDVKGQLLELEEIKQWRTNPDRYSSLSCALVFALIKRNFAPLDERMKCAIQREREIPSILKAARENLDPQLVPRIYVEIALEQLPGIVSFFDKDVPEAFKTVKSTQLQEEFAQVNNQVKAALKDYGQYLEREILPNANGDYALGAELYRKKLLYEEMIDEPLPLLRERGYAELRRLQ
ncbi:MAG TPA: DUF885 family protein, partial [Candidatus Obscuribacterales bacterium]